MEPGDSVQIIFLIILLLLSAFFSSAETALTTSNKIKLKRLSDDGNKNATLVLKITDNPDKMLSAILIGNNIVNIFASSLATIFVQNVFGNWAVSIGTGILTLLVLIFGEITPKTAATLHANSIALVYAKPIYALMTLLTPVIFIVNILSSGVMFILGLKKEPKKVPLQKKSCVFSVWMLKFLMFLVKRIGVKRLKGHARSILLRMAIPRNCLGPSPSRQLKQTNLASIWKCWRSCQRISVKKSLQIRGNMPMP